METPAGETAAEGGVSRRRKFLGRPYGRSMRYLATRFPTESGFYFQSDKNSPGESLWRLERYQTQEGMVIVTAEFVDKE